ncbi:MAG: class I adenylate-forming enzyme family protein [Thermodesulfobacteriota bacterium]
MSEQAKEQGTPRPRPAAEFTFTRFEAAAAKSPRATALLFLGRRFSFARLKELVDRCATGLARLGLAKGDRLVIYLYNCPQFIITFLACQKLGVATVLVSPIYTSHELAYMIKDAGAKAVVCHDTNYGYVREAAEGSGLERIIVTGLLDMVGPVKRAIAALMDVTPTGRVEKAADVMWFKKLLKAPAAPPKVDLDPVVDLSYILYTGGTTGFPKGVPGNHWGQVSYVNDISFDVFKGFAKEGGDVYIAINPLFHIMALGLFMALGLNLGNTTVLMPMPVVDAILKAVERYHVRWLLGVPALYRMILENDRLDQYDLSSLTYCYCGGDALPAEVLKRWKARVGAPIYQVYGSTEAGHVTYSRLDRGDPAPMSIGMPLASRRTRIVDSDTLVPVAKGEVGELIVTSDHSLKHYLNKPDETKAAFVQIDGETYYRTSDFVREGEGGEIIYVERSADILKHKGYRVSASEVEAVLQDHPVVVGACVVGVPDPKVGERVKAIVVLKDDAKGVAAAELIRHCRDRLAPYKVPSYIEFRDMLPKSKVGKLLRREIRDEERRKQAKDKTAAA